MKTILITGGAGGIARSVIERLKDRYFIYVGVSSFKQLELVTDRYKSCSNICVIKLDLSTDDIYEVGDFDIDILICNAALGIGGSLIEMDVCKVRDVFEVNVFRNLELIQIVLRNMILKGSGKVIIMSSLISFMPISFLGAYASSKASLNVVSRVLKKELGLLNKNISVHLVEPGMYKTGFNDVMLENKYKDMDHESFFKEQIDLIRRRESLFWGLFQKKSLDSITNKIVDCVCYGDSFVYSAPFFQRVVAKIYSLLFL